MIPLDPAGLDDCWHTPNFVYNVNSVKPDTLFSVASLSAVCGSPATTAPFPLMLRRTQSAATTSLRFQT